MHVFTKYGMYEYGNEKTVNVQWTTRLIGSIVTGAGIEYNLISGKRNGSRYNPADLFRPESESTYSGTLRSSEIRLPLAIKYNVMNLNIIYVGFEFTPGYLLTSNLTEYFHSYKPVEFEESAGGSIVGYYNNRWVMWKVFHLDLVLHKFVLSGYAQIGYVNKETREVNLPDYWMAEREKWEFNTYEYPLYGNVGSSHDMYDYQWLFGFRNRPASKRLFCRRRSWGRGGV